jgi:hypothetical protein
LGRVVGRRLHTPEPTEHGAHFTQVQPCHRCFGPCQALQRGAILGFGDVVDITRIFVIAVSQFGLGAITCALDLLPTCIL